MQLKIELRWLLLISRLFVVVFCSAAGIGVGVGLVEGGPQFQAAICSCEITLV